MDFLTAISIKGLQGPPPPLATSAANDSGFKASASFETHLLDQMPSAPPPRALNTRNSNGGVSDSKVPPRNSVGDREKDTPPQAPQAETPAASSDAASQTGAARSAAATEKNSANDNSVATAGESESPVAGTVVVKPVAEKPKAKTAKTGEDDKGATGDALQPAKGEITVSPLAVALVAGEAALPLGAGKTTPASTAVQPADAFAVPGALSATISQAGVAGDVAAAQAGVKADAAAAGNKISDKAVADGVKDQPSATSKVADMAASMMTAVKAQDQIKADGSSGGANQAALPGLQQLAAAAQAALLGKPLSQPHGGANTSNGAANDKAAAKDAATGVAGSKGGTATSAVAALDPAARSLTLTTTASGLPASAPADNAAALKLMADGAKSAGHDGAATASASTSASVNGAGPGNGAPVASQSTSFETLLHQSGLLDGATGHKDADAAGGGNLLLTSASALASDGSLNSLPFATLGGLGGIGGMGNLGALGGAGGILLPGQQAGMNNPLLMGGMPYAAAQVGMQISKTVSDGANQFSIRLDPAELGRVDVSLHVQSDGRVSAAVTADHQHTLDLMRRDAGILDRALQDSGLKTDPNSLSFSLRQQGQQGQQGGWQQAFSGGGGNAASSRTLPEASADMSAALSPAARSYVSNQALDITV